MKRGALTRTAPPQPPAPRKIEVSKEASDRARRLLRIPARHEQVRRVRLYDGEVGIRVLDDMSTSEAHAEARSYVRAKGFDPDGGLGTAGWIELSVAVSCSMLARAVVDPDTGFPLWDSADALRSDLTREDIAYLDEVRQEHQDSVAPLAQRVTQEDVDAVISELRAMTGEPTKSPFEWQWKRWPRHMLLTLLHTMAVQLRRSIG